MTQYARPTSDVTASGWTASSGSDLYAMLDESTASDADYIQRTGGDGTCEVALGSVDDPSVHTGHVLRVRSRKVGSGVVNSLTAMVYCGATYVGQWSCTIGSSFATDAFTLDTAEAALITDYSDLRVRLAVDWVSGFATGMYVSWVVLETPDASTTGDVTGVVATAPAAAVAPGVTGFKATALATVAAAPAAAVAPGVTGVRVATVTATLATAAAAAGTPVVTATTSEVLALVAAAPAAAVAPGVTAVRVATVTATLATAPAAAGAHTVFGTVPWLIPAAVIGGRLGGLVLCAAVLLGGSGRAFAGAAVGRGSGREFAGAAVGGQL